jgi:hypothetical protein
MLDRATFEPRWTPAEKAGIPLVAFNVDTGIQPHRIAYIGENPRFLGGERRRRDRPAGASGFSRPVRAGKRPKWLERRLQGVFAGLAGSAKVPAATVVRLSGDAKKQQATCRSRVPRASAGWAGSSRSTGRARSRAGRRSSGWVCAGR